MTDAVEFMVRGGLIGVGGAVLMARSPTIVPPMIVGLGTIVAPWFVMQPAMGLGFATVWRS